MRSAFTMIEIVFAIAIIGILTTVAIPKLAASRGDAKISALAKNVSVAMSEISAYAVSKKSLAPRFETMSHAASGMMQRGEATQSGKSLLVKMNTVNDCLIVDINTTESSVGLKLEYGDPQGDEMCERLQNVVDLKGYSIALFGQRVRY